jgi:hypothetical protein
MEAKVRGLLELMSSTTGNGHVECVNRDLHATNYMRRCVVLMTRLEELTPSSFVEQPLRQELRLDELKPIAGERSKKAGWCQHEGIHFIHMTVEHFAFDLHT